MTPRPDAAEGAPATDRWHRLVASPFLRFLVTGGVAPVVNVGSRLVLSLFVPFESAVVIAYLFGMATALLLARAFVFEPSGQKFHTEAWRFTAVNVVALGQVWLVSVGLTNWILPAIRFTWNIELVAHAIGVLSPVATSYYGHKLFTFRSATGR